MFSSQVLRMCPTETGWGPGEGHRKGEMVARWRGIWSGCVCSQKAGRKSWCFKYFSFFFGLGPQPMELCCLHSGWFFLILSMCFHDNSKPNQVDQEDNCGSVPVNMDSTMAVYCQHSSRSLFNTLVLISF